MLFLGIFRRFSVGFYLEMYILSYDMMLIKEILQSAVTVQAELGTEEAEECSGVQSMVEL